MRVFSGIKPTGDTTFGNYSGGFRQYAATQELGEAFFCIVDLHAITVEYDPADLHTRTYDLFSMLIATGLDPERSTIFCQSHVTAHAEAAWLLGAVTSYGQLGRMTQFKEKGEQQGFSSAALFNYPVLMAGDILLYRADRVPIGDDQRQHLELARDIAERFNSRFGQTFVVPEGIYPEIGARIMDLQDPLGKMGKTGSSEAGTIRMLDDARRDPPQGAKRDHRLGLGGATRRRQARRDEPDRHLLGRRRRDAGGDREPLRRLRLRAVQGRRRRGGGRACSPRSRSAIAPCARTRRSSGGCSRSAPTRPARSPRRCSSRCTSAWASCVRRSPLCRRHNPVTRPTVPGDTARAGPP